MFVLFCAAALIRLNLCGSYLPNRQQHTNKNVSEHQSERKYFVTKTGSAFWTEMFKIGLGEQNKWTKTNKLSHTARAATHLLMGNNVFQTCVAFIINSNGWQWRLGSMLRGGLTNP